MPVQRSSDTLSRPLEVATDTPHLPTLSIISPTPRAFTFPINHSVTDSPFSSPSSSPFEPDVSPIALTCTTSSSAIASSTASSIASATTTPTTRNTLFHHSSPSPTPPPSIQNRRKSSSSDSTPERRPKKGDDDYVKRPENAFILFRRKCCEDRQQAQAAESQDGAVAKKQRQADLSKTISQQWKCLSPQDRQYWEELAKEKKKEHEQMYPNYVYRPQRSRDKDPNRVKTKKPKGVRGDYEHDTDTETLSFVLPFPSAAPFSRRHGRSASAPTPPLPYQSIQLPNVYMPSCPTSPSLLPLINRRTSHPNHPHGSLSQFDYLPTNGSNTLMLPSFGQAGEFNATLQSPEFYQGMFELGTQPMTRPAAPTLSPLSMNMLQDPSMLHSLVSPVSSNSSGPSSPHTGPFTPTTMLANSFSNLCSFSNSNGELSNVVVGGETSTEMDMQTELQLQQDLYSAYSWEANSIWQTCAPPAVGIGMTDMLLGDDFDLSAIPPIELGLPKFGGEFASPSSSTTLTMDAAHFHDDESQQQRNVDGMFGFDDMMSRHGF
jgi:hypothetical protein